MISKFLKMKLLAIALLLAMLPFAGAFACACEKSDTWFTDSYSTDSTSMYGNADSNTNADQYNNQGMTKMKDQQKSNSDTSSSNFMATTQANDADTGSSSSDSAPYNNYPN